MKRIKPTFWLRTITAVPYLSRDEWESLDLLSKWLIAVRARFLVMTFVSCLIGGLLAFKIGKFHLSSWLLCTVGFLLAHAAGNILNDLIDYVLGVDKGDYLRLYDEPHPLAHNLMSLKEHLLWTSLTAALSFLPWIYLVHLYGSFALLLFLIEVFLLLFYTYPLKYIGLGELAIFIIWGPLMVGGCYFASAGEWDWRVVLASIPHALGVTSVLLGDHLDKYEFDKKKGIRTLPVILGEKRARMLTILTILFQYLALLYLIATRFFSPVMLLVLFTLSSFLKVLKLLESPMPMQKPEESLDFGVDNWPRWFRAGIFWHNRKFGIAFIIALIIDVMLVRYRGCLII